MKVVNTIAKVLIALAAVAGAVYVIATYGEKIVAWAKGLLKCCNCCDCECDGECECNSECSCECAEEDPVPCEEVPAAEEAPVEEVSVVEESAVVAEDTDFEG